MKEISYLVSEAAHMLSNLSAIGPPSRLERGANYAGPVCGLLDLSVLIFSIRSHVFSSGISLRNGQFAASGRFGFFDEPQSSDSTRVHRVASLPDSFRLLVSARDTARARARSLDTRLRTLARYRPAATDFHMRRLRLYCLCTE